MCAALLQSLSCPNPFISGPGPFWFDVIFARDAFQICENDDRTVRISFLSFLGWLGFGWEQYGWHGPSTCLHGTSFDKEV